MMNAFQHVLRKQLPCSLLKHGKTAQVALRSLSGATGSNSGSSTKSPPKPPVDSDEYKVQEYFEYNPNSYYDFEHTLIKYRLEQPIPGIKY